MSVLWYSFTPGLMQAEQLQLKCDKKTLEDEVKNMKEQILQSRLQEVEVGTRLSAFAMHRSCKSVVCKAADETIAHTWFSALFIWTRVLQVVVVTHFCGLQTKIIQNLDKAEAEYIIVYMPWWLRNHRNLSIARCSHICNIWTCRKWHRFGKHFQAKGSSVVHPP